MFDKLVIAVSNWENTYQVVHSRPHVIRDMGVLLGRGVVRKD